MVSKVMCLAAILLLAVFLLLKPRNEGYSDNNKIREWKAINWRKQGGKWHALIVVKTGNDRNNCSDWRHYPARWVKSSMNASGGHELTGDKLRKMAQKVKDAFGFDVKEKDFKGSQQSFSCQVSQTTREQNELASQAAAALSGVAPYYSSLCKQAVDQGKPGGGWNCEYEKRYYVDQASGNRYGHGGWRCKDGWTDTGCTWGTTNDYEYDSRQCMKCTKIVEKSDSTCQSDKDCSTGRTCWPSGYCNTKP